MARCQLATNVWVRRPSWTVIGLVRAVAFVGPRLSKGVSHTVRVGLGALAALGAVSVGTLGAVGARSLATRRVMVGRAGRSVPLGSLAGVIDTGRDLWRGPAPNEETYGELAQAGCSLIVDLRAEADPGVARSLAEAAGLELLLLPTDNGRVPEPAHVDRFSAAHESTAGATYVHCEAGEGRTGAIIGAHEVRRGSPARDAMADALSVGSLTFAQLVFIASGGAKPGLASAVDWGLDRPTEMLFDLARRWID